MRRLHLPNDWKRRAARALRKFKRPGVAAVCFWCGHQYRRGEFSPETQSAHLLQCPEYPKGAKRRMQKRKGTKPKPAPRVGIVYFVGDTLFIDSTPITRAGSYGDHVIHERGHDHYWAQLVRRGAVPDAEYEEYPRGRVSYNEKTGKYTLLADRCILGRKNLVSKILSRMHLAASDTETGTDRLYRCFRCLGQSR